MSQNAKIAFNFLPDISFEKSEKFRAISYFNFGVLLQEKLDLIPETEYATQISIYHSMDNTKKCHFKTLF